MGSRRLAAAAHFFVLAHAAIFGERLSQDLFHDSGRVHPGEPFVEPMIGVDQFLMIQPQ